MDLRNFLSVICALMVFPLGMWAQNNSYVVSGSVSNSSHEPLVGVSVLVKETNVGTTTDVNGRFSIKAAEGQKLEFHYIGHDTKVVVVTGKEISVVMQENLVELDDVVVIGYGTQKKSDLTGSLSSVAGEDIVKTGDANITQSLQGKAPGVYVTSNSGTPGAGATVRIRGYGSISTDLTPLYVVDGQPMEESNVNAINPIDIENIEILKDASATAIYGSRGANGVVLITTKKGKAGKATINFDASFGWANAANRVRMMNSDQLYAFLQEAYANDGMRMPRNITRLYHLDGEGKGPLDEYGEPTDINVYDTDWWNETTRMAFKHSYNLSVSGGTDKLTSHFSIGYMNQEGIIKTSDYERITLRANNEYKFNKWIAIGQTLGVAYVKSHDLNTPINEILLPDPFTPVYAKDADKQDSNYEYNKYMGSQYSYYSNPVAKLNRQKKEHINRNIDGTVYLNINLGLKGLYFKTMLGFEWPEYTYTEFNPFFDLRPNDTPYNLCTNLESKFLLQSSVASTSTTELNYTFQNTLSYDNTFGKHSISAVAGFTWEAYTGNTFTAQRLDTPSNSEAFQIVGAGTKEGLSTGYRYETYLISYLGRVNYNYDNRYLATVSVRTDGSSKFASGNRWGTFPSFSLGWRIDQEEFFKNWDQNVWNGVKLRGGWGQIGNQNIPSYAYADIVSTYETWVYGFNSGQNILKAYASTSKGNKNIKWETVEQGNVGVDLGFFKNSLTLSVDAYIKTTRDMLMQNPLPNMAGYPTTPWVNAGSVENRGLEFLIGYQGKTGDFRYAVSANFTFQKNKLVETGTNDPIWGSVSKNEIGEEFGRFYGYVYDGIFQSEEEVRAHVGADGKTLLQPLARPGDARFKNISGDNRLDSDDRTYIGNPNPDVIYGGNIELGYKGFDFALYFQGVAGNDIWTGTKALLRQTSMTNLLAETYTDAWRKAGDKTDVFGISRKDDNDNYRTSSWYVQDGSFLKIKSVQLGYTFPKKWIEATRVASSLRLYVSAENLFTITKFKYMDPEVPNGSALNMGMENLGYPNPRTFTVGVNVQF